MSGQSFIVLKREFSANSVLRKLKVYVDGEFVYGLKDGETAKFPVSPGAHEVIVRMDWTSSLPFQVSVEVAETATLSCAPNYDYFSSLYRMITSSGSFWSITKI